VWGVGLVVTWGLEPPRHGLIFIGLILNMQNGKSKHQPTSLSEIDERRKETLRRNSEEEYQETRRQINRGARLPYREYVLARTIVWVRNYATEAQLLKVKKLIEVQLSTNKPPLSSSH